MGVCTPCNNTSYAADAASAGVESGAIRCLACPAGHSCAAGLLGAPCPEDTYVEAGAGVCSTCPKGYHAGEGAAACEYEQKPLG